MNRHIKRPATASDLKNSSAVLVHTGHGCDGQMDYGFELYGKAGWRCLSCGRCWDVDVTTAVYSDATLGGLFAVIVPCLTMLVWETSGRTRYTVEVPFDPNDPRERVKW